MAEVQTVAFGIDASVDWRRLSVRIGGTAHVHAGAEAPPGPGDDYAAHRAVETGIYQDFTHLPQQRDGERIGAFPDG